MFRAETTTGTDRFTAWKSFFIPCPGS